MFMVTMEVDTCIWLLWRWTHVYGDYGGGHMFMVTMEVDTCLW